MGRSQLAFDYFFGNYPPLELFIDRKLQIKWVYRVDLWCHYGTWRAFASSFKQVSCINQAVFLFLLAFLVVIVYLQDALDVECEFLTYFVGSSQSVVCLIAGN